MVVGFAQNKKYRCDIGKTFIGSHVSNSPSAQTRYVSASTLISGVASFSGKSFFVMSRHFFTATSGRSRLYRFAMFSSSEAADTNVKLDSVMARPKLPNIGRAITGCGVGIDALASPI